MGGCSPARRRARFTGECAITRQVGDGQKSPASSEAHYRRNTPRGPVRLCGPGGAAGKEILFVCEERGFNVTRVPQWPCRVLRRRTLRGWLLRPTAPSDAPHRQVVSRQVRDPICARLERIDRAAYRVGLTVSDERCQLRRPVVEFPDDAGPSSRRVGEVNVGNPVLRLLQRHIRV